MGDRNSKRYNQLWGHVSVQNPSVWSTWSLLKDFKGKRCLEVGCGNYPRIPFEGSYFLDLSRTAVANLKAIGLKAVLGTAKYLPFESEFFDLVVAWDVLEHIEDDEKAFAEITRVLRRGGYFLFSLPLGRDKFGAIDKIAGHERRYEPKDLENILSRNGFRVVKYRCPFFYKYLGKLPFLTFLVERSYKRPSHTRYFGLPKPAVNALVRIYAFLSRFFVGAWKEGQLAGLEREVNINVFCRKE